MTFCGHHSDKLTTLSSWRHVLEAKRVGLRILNFGGDAVDTRSATGRLMLNTFAAIRAERRHEQPLAFSSSGSSQRGALRNETPGYGLISVLCRAGSL